MEKAIENREIKGMLKSNVKVSSNSKWKVHFKNIMLKDTFKSNCKGKYTIKVWKVFETWNWKYIKIEV